MPQSRLYRRDALAAIGTIGAGLVGAGSAAGKRAATEQWIVGTTPGAAGVARQAAASVRRTLDFGDIGQAVAGRFSEQAIAALRRNPNVRYVEANGTMQAISIDSSDAEVPWGVDRVDAERVHDTDTGAGADIAIVDTGIDSDHPDLEANLGTGKAIVTANGPYAQPWDDDNGHGTHCAGIAGAADDGNGVVGVSTEATLHAVKVIADDGSGTYDDVAAGLEWVADQGHDVASLSIGGPTSSTIQDACEYAHSKGVLLVAAAGNDSTDVENTAPATYSEVVAVSATDREDRLASFSNYGADIELAAPGVDITSTWNDGGYASLNGTSMACPHVSGAAGQLVAAGYDRDGARQQLTDAAEDIGLATDAQGAGLLDVEGALGGSTDNSTPSVGWVTPSAGETVSGTITVQVDASDPEDADDTLDLSYTVDGGTSRTATYSSTSGYHEDEWDTTGVDDGVHTLTATVTDSAGASSSSSIDVSVDNVTETNTAPSVDSVALTDESNPAWTRTTVDWAVSDADGNLASVETELLDSNGRVLDSTQSSASGGSESGGHSVRTKRSASTVRVTVTDGAGATDSVSKSI